MLCQAAWYVLRLAAGGAAGYAGRCIDIAKYQLTFSE